MECTVEELDGKKILTLEGDLTIVNAAELRRVLQEAIDDSAHVELNIGNVTEIDLSCLQLFCSAHRTSKNHDRSISIAGNRPEVFREAVREAGFPHEKGCNLDPDDSCLWIDRA